MRWLTILLLATSVGAAEAGKARWIGVEEHPTVGPRNLFTYFRKVVDLDRIPADATLRYAADSNAQLWINGHRVRRKVTRYTMEKITAETVDAAPFLRTGKNTVVFLHHNWGDIVTFQRTDNKGVGLWVDATWIRSDGSWKRRTAPQFVRHEKQILAVNGVTPRIRFPQIVDGRKTIPENIHDASFDDGDWEPASVVTGGPWPQRPNDVETPGQHEYLFPPRSVLAAGTVRRASPVTDDPAKIGPGMRSSICLPYEDDCRRAEAFLKGAPLMIEGKAGETKYVTFDFHQPMHGYPFLKFSEATEGIKIDFGFGEISRSQYSGKLHVNPTGWIDTGGVVGPMYADRYVTRMGAQSVELPDERTARWLGLHVHFENDGGVVLTDIGIVKSQYPFDVVGFFYCGNRWIDHIVNLSLIHAEVTMSDTYVDTPGREDGQWYEDARLRAVLTDRWSGDSRLRRSMIRTIAESQLPDGHFHDFPPSNYPNIRATFDWSIQWVAILHDEYMWTGDVEVIRTYWENLTLYWEQVLSHVDDKGLWRTQNVRADLYIGTGVTDRQSSGIVTPFVIERLRWSAEMAEAVGESEQAHGWRTAADSLAEAFRAYHIVSASGNVPAHVNDRCNPEDPNIDRGFCQAGQTMAVYNDLLTHEEALAVLEYAYPAPDGSPPEGISRWNNPTFSYRALKALSHVGLTERAVNHLVERFSQYLPGHPSNPVPLLLQGPYGGPLPEYWISREDRDLAPGELSKTQPGDETGSHGWAAVPILWLHDTLLGVQIVEPGGGKLRIAPQTGGLPFVEGKTVTPKGMVSVSWRPEVPELKIEIPEGVVAEVVLPDLLSGRTATAFAGSVKTISDGVFEIEGRGVYRF